MTMMTLRALWTAATDLPDWADQPIQGLAVDSRQVSPGQVFVALRSQATQDSQRMAQFMRTALQRGAVGVISEVAADELGIAADLPLYHVADIRQQLGSLQQRWLQARQPQPLARVAAVTGTNGKTTISRLIAELLMRLGHRAAVTGTTGNGLLPHLQTATHTTPDALQFQQLYYDLSQQGAEYLAIEASSHGLEQGRLAGTPIEVAVFSNLSRDHLDYHQTLENYAHAKARLFDWPSLRHAVINADDDYADLMIERAQANAARPQIWRYSTAGRIAEYSVTAMSPSLQGVSFTLCTPTGDYRIDSPLLGRFNVDNLVAALIAVQQLGFTLDQLVPLVPQLVGAPGRMQCLADQQRLFVVDYAHTPDALQQVLHSLRPHVQGQLWVVFGCGGDRDRGKRPLMVQAALTQADQVILTSDNPRTESPAQIFADMLAGQDEPVPVIEDRRLAIRHAVQQAQAGDIVVIAGKGHEDYQDIDGVRHWFDDVVEVRSAISQQQTPPQGYAVPAE